MASDPDQLIMDFKQTFSSEPGRRVLDHLKSICKCNPGQTCFDASNMYQTAYNLGTQWVADYIQFAVDKKIVKETDVCQTEPKTERTEP